MGAMLRYPIQVGDVSERPKVQHSKCCLVSKPTWVQIPPSPPYRKALLPLVYKGSGAFCFARNGRVGKELARLSYGTRTQPPTLRFSPWPAGSHSHGKLPRNHITNLNDSRSSPCPVAEGFRAAVMLVLQAGSCVPATPRWYPTVAGRTGEVGDQPPDSGPSGT